MEITFINTLITQQQIINALHLFDSQYPDTETYDNNWLQKKSYKYVIQYAGRLYPPKQILSLATGISTTDFGGGEQTNRVFRELGFVIETK